jgi:hypothetical protein
MMAKAEAKVAAIPFRPPPPKADDKGGTHDLLLRVFQGDAAAREAVYEYVCKVREIVHPDFVNDQMGKDDNPHSAAVTAIRNAHPMIKPTLQYLVIINGLATMGNVEPFHNQFESRCDRTAFRNFMSNVHPCLEASIRGTDLKDVGEQRVKNAVPTFGNNMHTFVAMMRASYAGALVPLTVLPPLPVAGTNPPQPPPPPQQQPQQQAPAAAAAAGTRPARRVPT